MIIEVSGPVLQYYDASKPVRVQVDASQYGRDFVAETLEIIMKKPLHLVPMRLQRMRIHRGVQKCKERARDVLFWLGMRKEIKTMGEKCLTCQEYRNTLQKELLRLHDIPVRPWQMVATDFYVWNNINYVLVVDYYSNYFEIAQLASKKSSAVIQYLPDMVYTKW